MPSTRTPEGLPSRCPLCGAETNIEFSEPAGDATCPQCGCLLWLATALLDQFQQLQNETANQPNDITAYTSLEELGADSLDTVELVMELEEEFDINIPPEDAERIRTIEDAIRYIERILRERREGGEPPE